MQNAVMLAAAVVALNYKWIKFCFFCRDSVNVKATSIADWLYVGLWATYEKEKRVIHNWGLPPPPPPPPPPGGYDPKIQFGQSKPSVHDPGHNKDELDKVRHINKNIDGNTGI